LSARQFGSISSLAGEIAGSIIRPILKAGAVRPAAFERQFDVIPL
jgi:hypothetical protein